MLIRKGEYKPIYTLPTFENEKKMLNKELKTQS